MNIYLIGMMGSGKSTVGKILAKKMEMPFVDLDETIGRSTGKSINDIFKADGEDTFRKLESDHKYQLNRGVSRDETCSAAHAKRRGRLHSQHVVDNGVSRWRKRTPGI